MNEDSPLAPKVGVFFCSSSGKVDEEFSFPYTTLLQSYTSKRGKLIDLSKTMAKF